MKRFFVTLVMVGNVLFTVAYAEDRLSMGYIYGAPNSFEQIVQNTKESINVVSPTGFDLTTDGRLNLTITLDQGMIDRMHAKNIKVTPFLSNHWGKEKGKNALDHADRLVSEVKKVVEEYNLDGINVDLENLPAEYKDKLTYFVRALKEALGSEKTVSVAVAANPYGLTSTWLATYDYEELGKCADYLVLMAYDEHGQGGSEGSVASINYVKLSLEAILKYVSRDKVILGIPLYGRYWKEGKEIGGDAFTMSLMENMVKKYKLEPELDQETMSIKLVWEIKEDDEIEFNGAKLEAGIYTFWYENEETLKAKIKLINEKNLLGAALWALNQEDSKLWNYYSNALNEIPYESERTIRTRERQAIYQKITVFKKQEIAIKPFNLDTTVSLEDDRNAYIEELLENQYRGQEHLIEDEKKYYLMVKRQKVFIKSYNTKSHLTVTFL